ncbi:1-deoxy-D-xylulose-5-phosphate synthase [Actinoplanes sp. KI2]|uniref:1-deoxy-D-xylulose-5-phosphate synthase n=1 Tax=Actinoplanes sp. KI2 TaxID=2983315 RepID=UPI0021D5D444|nr:1-deoxy-D-xylulose-5-phosphate synthase [Actinoplanes sp. KI2]MCU7728471.1 1-deoxy-D-xylulose-5-phosphate synthase [Actinoplanes sp. KI2]
MNVLFTPTREAAATAEPAGMNLAALRAMSPPQLSELAVRLRQRILEVTAGRGGHVGSNLGIVEVTLALHRSFDSPHDRLLFDTGHQTYPHKLLTGRWDAFDTLRTRDGLSGYASQAESRHDVIENSHASTALSYADGLARAYRLRGERDRWVVPIIGDGALTGGMAWEALNNLGASGRSNVVVVLNDNGRSYAPTIGALARHLAISRGGLPIGDLPGDAAPAGAAAPETPGALFTAMGLTYIGPVDGHDIAALEAALARAKSAGPALVHVVTRKGLGFPSAEADDEEKYHAPGVFDLVTGARSAPAAGAPATWTGVFGDELVRVGAERDDVVAITAAMPGPTGLLRFGERFPERLIDVGIAEQHAMTSAAGLAMGGLRPVVALYATFLNRAFDQLLMDAALHRLPVTVALDRAGVTGDDGASHNGMWDLALLQVVPGLRIAAPRDGTRLRALLRESLDVTDGPTVIRFPKGSTPADVPAVARLGSLDVLRESGVGDVLFVSVGAMAGAAMAAAALLHAQGLGATVVDPRWVRPLDPALVALARRHRLVTVVEDGCRCGGVGDAVARLLRDAGVDTPVRTLGLPAEFLAHAKRDEILEERHLTGPHLARVTTEFLARRFPVRWPLPETLVGRFLLNGTSARDQT